MSHDDIYVVPRLPQRSPRQLKRVRVVVVYKQDHVRIA